MAGIYMCAHLHLYLHLNLCTIVQTLGGLVGIYMWHGRYLHLCTFIFTFMFTFTFTFVHNNACSQWVVWLVFTCGMAGIYRPQLECKIRTARTVQIVNYALSACVLLSA